MMRPFVCLLFLFSVTIAAQKKIPKDYFISPLTIPLSSSGTFGELRSNHLHSGLDLRTNSKEGYPVLASAAGVVSRIKISHFGYGKALYIRHKNGYTTVYAHLKKFSPAIEAYVKKRQYAKASYQIELFPKSSALVVQQGERIALSGNTGGSGGPHLHFEIRDSASRPMNPLDFGIQLADEKPPVLQGVWLYPLDSISHCNYSAKRYKLRLMRRQDGSYEAEKIKAFGRVGVGFSAFDRQDLSHNRNGIYAANLVVNGTDIFNFKMQRFPFNKTRYINRFIDYPYFKINRKRIVKLFIEKNNLLPIYPNKVNQGKIKIQEGLSYNIRVQLRDYNNNQTTISIPIEGEFASDVKRSKPRKTKYYAKHLEDFVYESNSIDLFIPKKSLYEDTYLRLTSIGDTIHAHNSLTPLHRKMTIAFDVSPYSEAQKKKLFVGRLRKNKYCTYSKTYRKKNRLFTKTKYFGKYTICQDTVPPVIEPVNVSNGKWMHKDAYLKMKIKDKESGIASYRATINGKFALMEYDYKTGLLLYDFNDRVNLKSTKNNFRLAVLDQLGNRTTFDVIFFKKYESP